MDGTTTQGDADASGLTNPGELHLNIGAPGPGASAGELIAGVPWWWLVTAALVVLLILKR
jgi:hypothetical protein